MKNFRKQKMISREVTMQLMYQLDINKQEIENINFLVDSFIINNEEIIIERYKELFENEKNIYIEDIIDKNYIQGILEVIKNQKEKIDALINDSAKNWSINRMLKVDLAIIRLCIAEMLSNQDIPNKVSINEAIQISKVYCDDKTPKFINGILGSVVDKL